MRNLIVASIAMLLLVSSGCSSRGTEVVVKPRYHKSWYKNHKWNKRYKLGRIQVRPFEKQGVRKVKMKG